jgi:hypothetical protein
MNTIINKIDSFKIISDNPQVIKINEQLFYGYYLLEKDDKIFSTLIVNPKTDNIDEQMYKINPECQCFVLYSKTFILCTTQLNKCIRLFREDFWTWTNESQHFIHMAMPTIKFDDIKSSLQFIESLSQLSENNENKPIDFDILNDEKQKSIISPETYEKIKKDNKDIVEHLISIGQFNKIKNDEAKNELKTLKIMIKEHYESSFIELNKKMRSLKKENDVMKRTISLQEVKINSYQNTISDLEKYIIPLGNITKEMDYYCFHCDNIYIESDKKINCKHKYICNYCTLDIGMCPKCNTIYG